MIKTNSTEQAFEYFKKYVSTYDIQPGWKNYSAETFIEDMIYGIAISIAPIDYGNADGYEKFRKDLSEYFSRRYPK